MVGSSNKTIVTTIVLLTQRAVASYHCVSTRWQYHWNGSLVTRDRGMWVYREFSVLMDSQWFLLGWWDYHMGHMVTMGGLGQVWESCKVSGLGGHIWLWDHLKQIFRGW